jgi:hypothetical protein
LGLLQQLQLPPPRGIAQAGPAAAPASPQVVALQRDADRIVQALRRSRSTLDDQLKINAENKATALASAGVENAKRLAGALFSDDKLKLVQAPDKERWLEPTEKVIEAKAALRNGDVATAKACLDAANAAAIDLERCVNDYVQGLIGGAGSTTSGLQVTAAAGAVAATVVTGGAAAAVEAGVLGTAVAAGVGAGVYGGAQEIGTQKGEKIAGSRKDYDLGAAGKRAAKDAVVGFVGALVGGALAKQFSKLFGSYLSKAISNEELLALGKELGFKGALPRDYFLTTGQRFIADFFGGAGAAPLTAVVSHLLDTGGLPKDGKAFATQVCEEVVKQGLIQVFITALAHGMAGRAKPTSEPPTEPVPGIDPRRAANDNVEVAANDNVEIGVLPREQQQPLKLAAGAEPVVRPPQAIAGGARDRAAAKPGNRGLNEPERLRAAAQVKQAEKMVAGEQDFLQKNPKRKLPDGPPEVPRPPELEGELKKLPKLDQPDERAAAIRELLERPGWSEDAVAYLKELERRAEAHAHNDAVDASGRAKETAETNLSLAKGLLAKASVTVKQALRTVGPNYKKCTSAKPYDQALGEEAFAKLGPKERALSPDHLWSLDRIANSSEMTALVEVYAKLEPGSSRRRQMLAEIQGIGDIKDNLASMRRDANRDWKRQHPWSELSRAEGLKRYGYDAAAFDRAMALEAKAIDAVRAEIARLIKAYGG